MYRFWIGWIFLAIGSVSGCGPGAGTEQAAVKYLDSEFKKWQAGEDNEAATLDAALREPPIGYEFYSTAPSAPGLFSTAGENAPAFRIKVKTTWVSQAGTELIKTNAYVLTWNASERKWDVQK